MIRLVGAEASVPKGGRDSESALWVIEMVIHVVGSNPDQSLAFDLHMMGRIVGHIVVDVATKKATKDGEHPSGRKPRREQAT